MAVRRLVRVRRERRHLPHASHTREVPRGRVRIVVVVVVEGAEGADDGDEYRHRVRVVVKSVEESNEVFVDQPVRADLPLKLSPLFTRGEDSADE